MQAAIALRAHPRVVWSAVRDRDTTLAVTDHVKVAEFIEGCDPASIYGYTTQDTTVLDPDGQRRHRQPDEGARLSIARSANTAATARMPSASMYGRAFTVDFEASNTVITLKFKQEPGVAGEQC